MHIMNEKSAKRNPMKQPRLHYTFYIIISVPSRKRKANIIGAIETSLETIL